MSERTTVVPGISIKYEGIFEADALYDLIFKWLEDHDYDIFELKNVQIVTEKGRDVDIFLEPVKEISDYAKLVVRVIYRLTDVKEKEVVIDGKKKKVSEGKVEITLIGLMDTDIEERWESKPLYFLMRQIYNKFVYRSILSKHEDQLDEDLTQLSKEIRAFLNIDRMEK